MTPSFSHAPAIDAIFGTALAWRNGDPDTKGAHVAPFETDLDASETAFTEAAKAGDIAGMVDAWNALSAKFGQHVSALVHIGAGLARTVADLAGCSLHEVEAAAHAAAEAN